MTYYSFLKDQSSVFQDETLGKRLGGMMRSGELNSENFGLLKEDQLFRPMTLEEMKAKEDIAFE